MARKIYGKTWWGKKWLDVFEGIDDENRLPRGRMYANKGAASSIKISGSVLPHFTVPANFFLFSYELKFLEIGTDKEYVHFLIQSVPRYSLTKIVTIIKSLISREVLRT